MATAPEGGRTRTKAAPTVWARWTDGLIIVKPDTVVGWHRAGFRLYWRLRSQGKRQVGRPRTGQETRVLIHSVAGPNARLVPQSCEGRRSSTSDHGALEPLR